MDTSTYPPDVQDNWLGLLIATIKAAQKDASKPNLPEPTKQDAADFLRWARELRMEQ